MEDRQVINGVLSNLTTFANNPDYSVEIHDSCGGDIYYIYIHTSEKRDLILNLEVNRMNDDVSIMYKNCSPRRLPFSPEEMAKLMELVTKAKTQIEEAGKKESLEALDLIPIELFEEELS